MKFRFIQLARALQQHWLSYVAEAAGLAFFVTSSSLLTLGLEHPASPLHQVLLAHNAGPVLRRVVLGIGMGLVLVVLTYNPWGKRSGAHINPAVTLGFWQLGKIQGTDACWYLLAQAGGGIGALLLLRVWLLPYYAHPLIHFLTTKPGPGGTSLAFAAEFGISFGLMAMLLFALHSVVLKEATGWLVGALVASYIIWESPASGMSLNPFRSLAAAIIAQDFASLWVYLVAPPLAMWLATVIFQRLYLTNKRPPAQPRLVFPSTTPPHYPVSTSG